MELIVEYHLLPEAVLKEFVKCDIETAKIINIIAILMDSRLFFEFYMKCMMRRFVWARRK